MCIRDSPGGLGLEVRGPREDPAAIGPRADGVLRQPPPDRLARDLGNDASLDHFALDVWNEQARQRQAEAGGELTGDCLDLDRHLWGKKPGAFPGESAPGA